MTTVYPTSTEIELFYDSTWNDISSLVVSPIQGFQGIAGTTPADRIASIGDCSMTLDNSGGLFTPQGTNVLTSEWVRGIPIRVNVTFNEETRNVFWGRVEDMQLDTSAWGERNVNIRALDYMDIITTFPMKAQTIDLNQRIDEAVQTLLDNMPIAPENTALSEGTFTFDTVFDDIKDATRASSEFSKLAISEIGFIYIREDDTVVVEGRGNRLGTASPAANGFLLQENGDFLLQENGDRIILDQASEFIFDNTMVSMDMIYGENVINEAYLTTFPREVGSSPEILFMLDKPIRIARGQPTILKGKYADPTGGNAVAGTNMIAPVATTDYLFNEKEDGTGANFTILLSVSATFYSDGVTFEFDTTINGWLIKCEARGDKITKYNPIEMSSINETSKNVNGTKSIRLKQKYQQGSSIAQAEATRIVEQERKPDIEITHVSFLANNSSLEMDAFLNLGAGDLISLKEDYNEVDSHYYIYNKEYTIDQGGIINFTYGVKETRSLQKGLTPIALEFGGEPSFESVIFDALPEMITNVRTVTARLNFSDFTDVTENNVFQLSDSEFTDGRSRILVSKNAESRLEFVSNDYDHILGKGEWVTDNDTLTIDTDHFVVVTYDGTSSANDPLIYIDGTSVNVTETTTPGVAGSLRTTTEEYKVYLGGTFDGVDSPNGLVWDVRLYDRILSQQEITNLNDGLEINDGLLFQTPTVFTDRLDEYIDVAIDDDSKITDNIYGVAGSPVNEPTGREI